MKETYYSRVLTIFYNKAATSTSSRLSEAQIERVRMTNRTEYNVGPTLHPTGPHLKPYTPITSLTPHSRIYTGAKEVLFDRNK